MKRLAKKSAVSHFPIPEITSPTSARGGVFRITDAEVPATRTLSRERVSTQDAAPTSHVACLSRCGASMWSAFLRSAVLPLLTVLIVGCGGDSRLSFRQDSSSNQGAPSFGNGAGVSSSGELQAKLIGGSPIEKSDAPQLVQIAVIEPSTGGDPGFSIVGRCTGTIISKSAVLTAAHCFPLNYSSALVEFSDGTQEMATAVRHPLFFEDPSVGAFFFDVAILKLAGPDLEDEIRPSFPLGLSRSLVADETLMVLGFGIDDNDESGKLRFGTITVDEVTPNHIVSSYPGSASNPCFGDSGAPLLIEIPLAQSGEAGGEGTPPVILGIAGLVSSGRLDSCGAGDVTLSANLQNPEIVSFIISEVPEAQLF